MLEAGPVRVVGTMSGTSLDGVDAAELITDGHCILDFRRSVFRPYSTFEQRVLQAALGKWSGPEVERATQLIERAHLEVLVQFPEAKLVGFHGQTLAHDPEIGRSLQIGRGDRLAEQLGRPVVWDFRSEDLRSGGQGAPLAPFYHFALAGWMGAEMPLAFVNLGGVGNLTWVDPRRAAPETEAALLAFDTGPANAPLNDLMQTRRGLQRDEDGALAAIGSVAQAIVSQFLNHPYFEKMPPKSLDRDDFAQLLGAVEKLSDADAAATLTACAAQALAHGLEHCPTAPEQVLLCGGGRHNRVLVSMIRSACGLPTKPIEEHGLDGDMIEAQAFGFLAVRVLRGLPTSAPATTGVRKAISGGRLNWPASIR